MTTFWVGMVPEGKGARRAAVLTGEGIGRLKLGEGWAATEGRTAQNRTACWDILVVEYDPKVVRQ
jgi:hypothetical protein